jgi:hypothetical protein
MGTFETIAIVTAVYAVVFLAHQASRGLTRPPPSSSTPTNTGP